MIPANLKKKSSSGFVIAKDLGAQNVFSILKNLNDKTFRLRKAVKIENISNLFKFEEIKKINYQLLNVSNNC